MEKVKAGAERIRANATGPWAGRLGRLLTAVPLMVVVVAPAAASWLGLVAVGREWLGLDGLWAVLVPLTFDAAALYVAALSWRSVLAGDSALVDRLLVWVYAVGSAGLNVWHAASAPAAVFFGAASVSAVVLWDRTLRQRRRDALRAMGAIEPALPRFRALRWVVAPSETASAWRVAIVEGITSPTEALARSRTSLPRAEAAAKLPAADQQWEVSVETGQGKSAGWQLLATAADLELERRRAAELVAAEDGQAGDDQGPVDEAPTVEFEVPAADPHADTVEAATGLRPAPAELSPVFQAPTSTEPTSTEPPSAELASTTFDDLAVVARTAEEDAELARCESKRDALLLAWRRLEIEGVPDTTDVMPAVEWLAERGVKVDKSGAYDLRRRLARKAAAQRPALTAVGGGR